MGKYTRQEDRNYFGFVVDGKDFDVSRHGGSISSIASEVWHRGDRRVGRTLDSSGIKFDLGDGDEIDIEEQQEIAADFLELHRAAIHALRNSPGVETCYLGLQQSVLVDSLGSITDVSPRLMRILLELEIQLTIWSCTVRPAEG